MWLLAAGKDEASARIFDGQQYRQSRSRRKPRSTAQRGKQPVELALVESAVEIVSAASDQSALF